MRLEASGLHHLRLAVIPADVFSSLATTYVVLSIHQVRDLSRKKWLLSFRETKAGAEANSWLVGARACLRPLG